MNIQFTIEGEIKTKTSRLVYDAASNACEFECWTCTCIGVANFLSYETLVREYIYDCLDNI